VDRTEPVKQAKAVALLQTLGTATPSAVVLWQVLAEFASQMRGWRDKGRITHNDFLTHISLARAIFPVRMPTINVLDAALALASRHSLSHWDSMILGACEEAGVTTLYTEDMGAPTTYAGIQLVNPFT
jgi:predicted nucleic acid-binding protein